MIIIYYRDKDGKIMNSHGNTAEKTLDELKEMAEIFNRDSGRTKRTAYIAEVEDDSITAYLFQKAAERKKWDSEALQDAISSIEDALDAVRGLEG